MTDTEKILELIKKLANVARGLAHGQPALYEKCEDIHDAAQKMIDG